MEVEVKEEKHVHFAPMLVDGDGEKEKLLKLLKDCKDYSDRRDGKGFSDKKYGRKERKTLHTSAGMFDIKLWDDIVKCSHNEEVKESVDNRLRLFYPINIKDATNRLRYVEGLLQIAYTGSKNHGTCSFHVLEVSTCYQNVVRNTVNVCTSFTNIVVEALYFHKHAILFAEKGKVLKAITFLGKCAELTAKMSIECDKMITEIDELSNSFRKAFIMCAKDYVSDAGEQLLAEHLRLFNIYLEDSVQKAINLEEEVEKAKIWAKAEQNIVERSAKDQLTFGLFFPISYAGSDTEVKSLNFKLALQKDGKERNADLAQSVTNFTETDYAQNEMVTAVACLEIGVKILEKVKLIFAHGRKFWDVVDQSFKLLSSSTNRLSDEDVFVICKEAFISEIKASGVGWLTMGSMYREAALDVRDLSLGLNRTRPKFLNGSEMGKLIESLSMTLLNEVAEDTARIDDVTSDCLYEILLANIEIAAPQDDADMPEETGDEGDADVEHDLEA